MKAVGKAIKFIKKNKSAILAVTSIVGLVYTVVKTAKEAPKAVEEIKAVEAERGELSKVEKAKIAFPFYIKPAIGCGLTALSMGTSAYFGAKSINSLLALAAMGGKIPIDDISGNRVSLTPENVKIKFYDPVSKTTFYSTTEDVLGAFYRLNKGLILEDFITLDSYCKCLGVPRVPGGEWNGWDSDSLIASEGGPWLEYFFEETRDPITGEPLIIIQLRTDPDLLFGVPIELRDLEDRDCLLESAKIS